MYCVHVVGEAPGIFPSQIIISSYNLQFCIKKHISFLTKYTKAIIILHWLQSNRICLQVGESVLFILFTLYGEQLVSGLKASKAIALWISLVIVPSTFAGGKCFLAYLSHPTGNNVLTSTDIQCTMQHEAFIYKGKIACMQYNVCTSLSRYNTTFWLRINLVHFSIIPKKQYSNK